MSSIMIKNLIYTNRLMLRPFTIDDVKTFHRLCSDEDVMRYIGDGSLPSIKAIEKSINRWIEHYRQYGYSLLALINRETNELMGFCGLITQNVNGLDKIELGYRLGKQFWHRGYATEATLKIKEYAFKQLKFDEVISIIQPNNSASIKIAKKLGMNIFQECEFNGQKVLIYRLLK